MNVREVNQRDDAMRREDFSAKSRFINESVNFIPRPVGRLTFVSGYVSINNVYAAD